jgi:hypothetical protein
MYCDVRSLYIVIPVFIVWGIMFIWTMKVLMKAEKEARSITNGTNPK